MELIIGVGLAAIIGYVASRIINKENDVDPMDIFWGVAGALLFGFVARAIGEQQGNLPDFSVKSLIGSLLGALAVILIYNAVKKRRTPRG